MVWHQNTKRVLGVFEESSRTGTGRVTELHLKNQKVYLA